ncbi:hypothetical protein SAMN05428975_1024 [Mucilaginibacter sp. OK268]|nr:hypothetical protein SAMN05428975_1024 [Mucilaginibacter sp. OK268]
MLFNTGVSQSIANVKPLNSPDIKRMEISPRRWEESIRIDPNFTYKYNYVLMRVSYSQLFSSFNNQPIISLKF